MKNKVHISLIAGIVFFCAPDLPAETQYGIEISEQVLSEKNTYNTDTLFEFNKDDLNNILILSPYMEWSMGKNVSFFLLGDFTWSHSFERDDDDGDADLGNAFLCLNNDKTLLSAGLQPFSFGRGFIFDDNAPGLSFDLSLSPSSRLNLKSAHVKGSSSLFSFSFGYEPGLFEKIELFGVVYHDSDDTVASLLNAYFTWDTIFSSGVVPLTSSKGDLYYAGIGADVFLGDFFVKATGIIQKGMLTFSTEDPDISRDTDISAFFADIEISRNLNDVCSMAGFFLIRSGGRADSRDDENHSFIVPRSMEYRTQIFANDQFGPYHNETGFISRGIIAPGLISPGLSMTLTPFENVIAKTVVSLLYPYHEPDDNASFYGWEWDLALSYTVRKNWELFAEAGYFRHGDFFKTEQGETPDPASRVLTGINVSF